MTDSMEVKILVNNIPKMTQRVQQAIMDGLWECGEVAEAYAKDKCPVDTGNLKNSITHQEKQNATGGECQIGSAVEYATYVEMGTYKMKAQPYLKPSIANHKNEYKERIAQKLRHISD